MRQSRPPNHPDMLFSAPAERNREPILAVLAEHFPRQGLVLEIASGTGQHAVHFAKGLPHLRWQPTDLDGDYKRSIAAYVAQAGLANLQDVLHLDATQDPWPILEADAIFNANMVHIAPWEVTVGLMTGAGHVLSSGGVMVTYGPYKVDGKHTSESNIQFEGWLKERDEAFGVRDIAKIESIARAHGLELEHRVEMPANNFCLVWRKR